jgi:E3 ubiquitin-protein ligase MARCH6
MGASTTILIGVPMILGKMALSLDWSRAALHTAGFILRWVRLVTDPVVDFAIEIVKDVIVLPLISSVDAFDKIVVGKLVRAPVERTGQSLLFSMVVRVYQRVETLLFSADVPSSAPTPSTVGNILAGIGQYAYRVYEASRRLSLFVATSDRLRDRIISVFAGYGLCASAIAGIALVGEQTAGSLGSMVREAASQHMMFLKVRLSPDTC